MQKQMNVRLNHETARRLKYLAFIQNTSIVQLVEKALHPLVKDVVIPGFPSHVVGEKGPEIAGTQKRPAP